MSKEKRTAPAGAEPDPSELAWLGFVEEERGGPGRPFAEHWARYQNLFSGRAPEQGPPRVWWPGAQELTRSNLGSFLRELGLEDYRDLHAWSVRERATFWEKAIRRLGIVFAREPRAILEPGRDPRDPRWLPGAELNIVESCFAAGPGRPVARKAQERLRRPDAGGRPAVVSGREGTRELVWTSMAELEGLVNRIAGGLTDRGYKPGDAIALYMPMNVDCVAAYLAAVRSGCRVVSVADSFSPRELRRRVEISGARAVITVDHYYRGGRAIELYRKVKEADAGPAIVIPAGPEGTPELRPEDLTWRELLAPAAGRAGAGPGRFRPALGDPYRVTNVLFSSGTTGDPKAIPWTHLTPIKCAMDGHFHHDIRPGDVVAWPTNIGWMMGPWLIYASLINEGTIALYEGSPGTAGFTRFVQDAGVTMLGLVPSLVRAWRSSGACDGVDWSQVRAFSSTGEPSNREDYLWLMSLAGYRAPVIEYLGGTEIGGGHITGTVVQPASPSTFTTAALGLDFVLLDDTGVAVPEGAMGELFLIPPSIGLSQTLLNRDHEEVYHAGVPAGPGGAPLRRHGDEFTRLGRGYFRAQGRVDDTMNLGGIKVSSLELEQVMDGHPDVYETAAVAVQPGGEGSERLVVFAVLGRERDRQELRRELQARVARELNPLFKVHDVVVVEVLPRTASNKLMRRELRARYLSEGR